MIFTALTVPLINPHAGAEPPLISSRRRADSGHGGACGSISSNYRFDPVEKRYRLTEITAFDVDDGRCFEYRYRYANGRKTLIDRREHRE
ncbi:MAG: hypothetical protein C1943_17025 [Halochromatium sp.]|nr:hypothetical protein [Halochromatium sp.]